MAILTAAFAALALFTPALHGLAIEPRQDDGSHWVNSWTSMPQLVEASNMPPAPFVRFLSIPHSIPKSNHSYYYQTSSTSVLKNATLRQTLHMSIGASKLRITISNTFGQSDLPISAASLALPANNAAGVSSLQPSSPIAAITVGGKSSFTVPRGAVVTSDEIAFDVKPQSMLTVSLYSMAGQSGNSITGHPGSRTTSWLSAGNVVNSTSLASGTASVHWYFVSAVQVYVPKSTGALLVLGDSITDGRGSDDNKNNRYVLGS
jgi:hypothetical protein